MNYLFFFVHPSKFHVFRNTINYLKRAGHQVDILITSKDILAVLVENEGWEYTNIFPEGRKMKNIPAYISSGVNTFRTLYRLYKYTKGKNYDLFITDDLLVYIGKLKKIPSIVFNDDDLRVVKAYAIILAMADHCLSPILTDLGKYNKKKVGFDGYKELAYLHPNNFKPNESVLLELGLKSRKYFILRLVSLRAYHDVGVSGLDNEKVLKLINILEEYGQVLITAERELPLEFEKYRIKIHPSKMIHVLAFADLYIGDSQTMSSEAAILGVPSFRLSDFSGRISVMEEKGVKYQSMKSYKTSDFSHLVIDVKELFASSDYRELFETRRQKMLSEKIDLTEFMIWLFENYPKSVDIMKENPDYQYKFR
jgi:predicted glycosyltransferase